jgi:hypothetical protein
LNQAGRHEHTAAGLQWKIKRQTMTNYIWPLSNSETPDEVNTSFGPRINEDRHNFHKGIDLPAEVGTKVFAVREGKVLFAGEPEPGADTYDSRHIVIETNDPADGLIYVAYLHLEIIDGAVTTGANVVQGQEIGRSGKHKATYPHLHLEILQGTDDRKAETSRHPFRYLPYTNTENFTAPIADRFNRRGSLMAARLLFGTDSKLEGDLLRVEVDLLEGDQVIAIRTVDFHDTATIHKKIANNDSLLFRNDIGVEGYQKSFMNDPNRTRINLRYGILVRNIPVKCNTLVARVFDVGNHMVSSEPIAIPDQVRVEEFVHFEDAAMPLIGWNIVRSTTETTVANDPSAAHSGSRGMRCADDSTIQSAAQRACIEFTLPAGRFEWIVEGWFNPTKLSLTEDQSLQLLRFVNGEDLCVAARIRNAAGTFRAGIVARDADGSLNQKLEDAKISATIIVPGIWRPWRLHLLRIGTREATAVLYLNDEEVARVNWDSTALEPLALRVGIGRLSAGSATTVLVDELRLTESSL